MATNETKASSLDETMVTLSPKEAAEVLGVSEKTLRRWRCEDGCGPAYVRIPTSGRVRYRRSAILDFLNANEEKPPAAMVPRVVA